MAKSSTVAVWAVTRKGASLPDTSLKRVWRMEPGASLWSPGAGGLMAAVVLLIERFGIARVG
jgi:hypothetical protein